jgi:hypothetical protein
MTLNLGVALSGDSFAADDWIAQVRRADEAGIDFVTFEDTFGRHGPDAVLVASRVAPLTRHIGLIPVATTTHTEPFHLSTALATLDWVSRGRAGWQVRVSGDPAEAALLGRRAPQGQPVVAALAHGPQVWDHLDADVLFVTPADADDAARKVRKILPEKKVFADIRVGGGVPTGAATFNGTSIQLADLIQNWWIVAGVDGFRLRVSDVSDISQLVAELRRRGLFQPSGHRTLRDRLGLPVAGNRYQEAGRA